MTNKKVMTLQDISCIGQCSLTVALPIISACGVETIVLPSAVLSSHTGFTGNTFRDLTEDIPGILQHWQSEGIHFDCIYTGYLGSSAQMNYVRQLKENLLQPDGILIVDPAMADHGKLYRGFDDSFVREMASLCGAADIILPNLTEAALMTGTEFIPNGHTKEYIQTLLSRLAELGAKKIVLKGISFSPEQIGIAVYDTVTDTVQYYFTDREQKNSHGTGDCFAAAFTGALMQGETLLGAASLAADFVLECIRKTADDPTHWYGVKFEQALPLLVNRLNH